METRFQRIFLAAVLALGPSLAWAERDILEDIASPEVERRHVKESKLDSENFELGVFYGLFSVEDFGSNPVMGLTLAYHATERVFFEAAYGVTETRETSYELLSGSVALLTEDEREYRYYNLSLGYNLFPGQIYLSENWTFNTNAYIIAGAGNTTFAAQEYFTYNLGAGLRLYTTDWLALDISMRGHVFTHELLGREVQVNNLEARMGVSVFF
ncbi:outer membrane beta-barrel domain-containing protein [Marinimicrobium sp. ABcell2]|uniref:outer membrane beta-barrel domain-containing protein n=1 Tax=Marinimicrobium sp. ABcell2 TaxID=3069751 RepID=UPI0027B074A6|nr:outer membrane beta-barrel domain-containing protein [Marinimicrobium sp. ABcell2]MDQ2076631.1 outer membrane beta-barrel domain-containing protein [Marinimicrobium sp. ABcell2]